MAKREVDKQILGFQNKKEVLMELKRALGFDITEEGLNPEALLSQYEMIKRNLSQCGNDSLELSSVYEVGFGCGANLFMFEQDGIQGGG